METLPEPEDDATPDQVEAWLVRVSPLIPDKAFPILRRMRAQGTTPEQRADCVRELRAIVHAIYDPRK